MNDITTDPAHERSCAAQRIRVGVTGLAAIFLMVMVAAAGLRPAPVAPRAAAPKETLAALGVAPGKAGATPVSAVAGSPPLRRAN